MVAEGSKAAKVSLAWRKRPFELSRLLRFLIVRDSIGLCLPPLSALILALARAHAITSWRKTAWR